MVLANTPWNGWAVAFPGSVEKGPVPSYIIMFMPLFLFGAQIIYARWVFQKNQETISKFYSNIITLHIASMILVSGSSSLNDLLLGYLRGYDGEW